MKRDISILEEYDRRVKAIEDMPAEAEISKQDYIGQMKRVFQRMIANDPEAESKVLWDAVVNKKWPEKTAMKVFSKVAPKAAYDIRGGVPLAEEIMADIRNRSIYKTIKAQEMGR